MVILVGEYVADQAPIAVVMTPIPVEFRAVREHLLDFREVDRVSGTIFYGGHLSPGSWRVVLVRPGVGNTSAAALAERAISRFRPELVLLVGIAGRLHPDLSVGDVVVGTKVYAIHSGKEANSGFRPRARTWEPDYGFVEAAKGIEATGNWRKALPGKDRPAARVEFRAIAAAEVVLDAKDSEFRRRISELYEDAAVIEMEGAGVGNACHLNNVPMVNIRAVSDHADGSKEKSDQAGGQELAASHAAAFAMALLADVQPARRSAVGGRPARAVLVSEAVPTMPGGADSSGWVAGGQVRVGDRDYLLVEDTFVQRTAAGGAARRTETRGIQVSPTPQPGAEHVWLRRIEGPDQGMLATERELLTTLRSVRGFPSVVQFESREGSSTLITGWPASLSSRLPCAALDLIVTPGPPLDEWRTVKLFKGLAGLCRTLAALHSRGRTHRHLDPASLVRLDNDHLVLRDLGLAGRGYVPGEGPPEYQAPEQRMRTHGRPGPHTDVFQLAAVAYHLLTGQQPAASNPLPLRHFRSELEQGIGEAVDAALSADTSARPSLEVLCAAFGPSSAEPPEERSCAS